VRAGIRLVLAGALLASLCGCAAHGHAARAPRGEAVFAASCTPCHTLTGHDTPARGGDLAIARLSVADVASFVRVMPVRLSPSQVEAVAAYVHAEARRSARGVSVH
jgi:mono/diheme cytochrome c family protein